MSHQLELYELTKKSFYGNDELGIKPVCIFFGISVQNQHKKLKKDYNFKNLWTKMSTDFGRIGDNGQILLSKKGFVRWIQSINSNIVKIELKETLSFYQSMIFDYLYNSSVEKELFFQKYSEYIGYKSMKKDIQNKMILLEKELNSFKFITELPKLKPFDLFSQLDIN